MGKNKIYIWGTGRRAIQYLSQNEVKEDQIIGFIETKKQKEEFWNKPVYEPQEIAKTEYDYILICIKNATKEIRDVVVENEIPLNKVVFAERWQWKDGTALKDGVMKNFFTKIVDTDTSMIKKEFPLFYNSYIKPIEEEINRYIPVLRNGFDLVDDNSQLKTPSFNILAYQQDYVRYRTFEFVANEINKKNIKGAVAELGVFTGIFARLINQKFSDRDMYLFDTFESFNEEEFKREVELGRCEADFYEGFKATSEEKVLSAMPYVDKCIVRKGFFPETAKGLESIDYAFVSIDVDFENSILEGLRYFYPRINEGGSIFVHDYNNRFLEGVKSAIETYEEENEIILKKVPLCDEGGTLVICK